MSKIVEEIIKIDKADEESVYYQSFLYKDGKDYLFPSKIRNLINYRLNIGYKELDGDCFNFDNELCNIREKIYYVSALIKYSGNDIDTVNKRTIWASLVSLNLYFLTNRIYSEYLLRSTNRYDKWLFRRKNILKKSFSHQEKIINNWFN